MANAGYSPCPAGTGKKIKFCCADLVQEHDKIQRMISGGQRTAALDYVNRLEAKYPGRACLLTTKASLLRISGHADEAAGVLEAATAQGNSTAAFAEQSLLAIEQGELKKALELLSRALSFGVEALNVSTGNALLGVTAALLDEGFVPSGVAYLNVCGSLGLPIEKIFRDLNIRELQASIPLLFRDAITLREPPPDSSAAAEFESAIRMADLGAFVEAEQAFVALDRQTPRVPAVWWNLALLRVFTLQFEQAVAAWRQYATLDVAAEDAVEAEARAMLLMLEQGEFVSRKAEVLYITRPIRDIDRVIEGLLSHPDCKAVAQQPTPDQTEPPPKSTFQLLAPTVAGPSGAPEGIRRLMAVLSVYGRQTDREAQLSIAAEADEKSDIMRRVDEIVGTWLEPGSNETTLAERDSIEALLTPRLTSKSPISHEAYVAAIDAERRRALHEVWANQPHAVLDGKSPREAAADPAYRNRAAALLLIIEHLCEGVNLEVDLDDVRAAIGLPAEEPISVAFDQTPSTRLHRVDWSRATPEELGTAMSRVFDMSSRARARMADAVLARQDASPEVRLTAVLIAVDRERNSDRKLALTEEARQLAEKTGMPQGHILLRELVLRLLRGEVQVAQRLVQTLATRHQKEPGVMESLQGILESIGAAQAREPDVAPAAAEPKSELWTPESARTSSGERPGLWLPS